MLVTTATSPSTMLVEFEPTAQAHLDDRPCDARRAEDDEGRQRQEIEPGGVGRRGPLAPRRLIGVEGLGQAAGQRLRIDVAADKAHALGHPLDVRRAVAADGQARAGERRLDQRRNGAFALGAGDVDRAERRLRIAKPGGEVTRRLEPDPHAVARPTLPVGQRVEPRHRRGKPGVLSHRHTSGKIFRRKPAPKALGPRTKGRPVTRNPRSRQKSSA